MKVYFVYSNNNKRSESLVNRIQNSMKQLDNGYELYTCTSYLGIDKLKLDSRCMYVFLFDEIASLMKYKNNLKSSSINLLITENLSSNYLIDSLKFVNDICYAKNDIELISNRIVSSYNKQTRDSVNKNKRRSVYNE